jgi:hypothetical protein
MAAITEGDQHSLQVRRGDGYGFQIQDDLFNLEDADCEEKPLGVAVRKPEDQAKKYQEQVRSVKGRRKCSLDSFEEQRWGNAGERKQLLFQIICVFEVVIPHRYRIDNSCDVTFVGEIWKIAACLNHYPITLNVEPHVLNIIQIIIHTTPETFHKEE